MDVSPGLIRYIQDAMGRYLSDTGRGDLRSVEISKVIERPFSLVLLCEAKTDIGAYGCAFKKVLHHPLNMRLISSENQAEVEFRMLSLVYPELSDSERCFVPEPIAVFPAEEAFLMEWVPGVLLCDRFKSARFLSPAKGLYELKELYCLLGQWLRRFQEATRAEPSGPEIFDITLDRCEEKLNLIETAKDRRCPARLKDVVLKGLNREVKALGGQRIETAGRHGDFGSWNVITNDRGVTVIDFMGSRLDSVAVDVLKMLVNLEDETSYVGYSSRRISGLTSSFLFGYGALPAVQHGVAVICETLHRVCSLCAAVVHTEGASLRRRIEKHLVLRRHLAWLLETRKPLLWTSIMDHCL